MKTVRGVDGCRNGWVSIAKELNSGRISWSLYGSLEALVAEDPTVVAIDVPIGLMDVGPRQCDEQARQLLGHPRRSSVFPAPIRRVLGASSYAAACSSSMQAYGKALSQQAWGIVPKIREVDSLIRSRPSLQSIVREVHPELCFYFLAGRRPMKYGKKSRDGQSERASVLEGEFGHVIQQAAAAKRTLRCAVDDVFDAFAALWTAERISKGLAETIPAAPSRDCFGLRMEMLA
jgi:predicted RNase H-like nuclease